MMAIPPNLSWLYDDGHGIELKPRKLGRERSNRQLLNLDAVLGFGKQRRNGSSSQRSQFLQRCIVRVTYAKGGSTGKWYSVGRYVTRESANDSQVGFNAERSDIDVPNTMAEWRNDGDERFYRLIISPEFGDRVNLGQLTRETMDRMGMELGRLQWMAVEHHNTDNPHVHVLLRGVTEGNQPLQLSRLMVQEGIRHHTENICTNQLGYRQEQDVILAQQRETVQARYTSLDRKLKERATESGEIQMPRVPAMELGSLREVTETQLRSRLNALQSMGLASPSGADVWQLDSTLERSLRTMQKTVDRQKMITAHGVISSDPSLPFRVIQFADLREVEGRILVHGQEEQGNGIRNYMLIESVRGEVLQVPQTNEVVRERRNGDLPPGTYVRIRKTSSEGDSARFRVTNEGDANLLLTNTEFLKWNAGRLAQLLSAGYGGWLGQMREVVQETVRENALSR
jgi:hypothetical protein